jgi:hypothetical protein
VSPVFLPGNPLARLGFDPAKCLQMSRDQKLRRQRFSTVMRLLLLHLQRCVRHPHIQSVFRPNVASVASRIPAHARLR